MAEMSFRDQMNRLPRRAIVAFAARCARRVQVLYAGLPTADRKALDYAIESAERFAKGLGVLTDFSPLIRIGRVLNATRAAAADGATDLTAPPVDGAPDIRWITAAAEAVAAANAAFVTAIAAAGPGDFPAVAFADGSATAAANAAKAAVAFADGSVTAAVTAIVYAANTDLLRMNSLDLGTKGELGQPIDPSEAGPLGPLWPNGAPDWYANLQTRTDKSSETWFRSVASKLVKLFKRMEESAASTVPANDPTGRLVLEAHVGEFADTEEVAGALASLCYALNAYHIAAGGNGLVVDDWEILVREPEFAGVDEP